MISCVSCYYRTVHFDLTVDEICKMLLGYAYVDIGAQSAVFRLLDLDISLGSGFVPAGVCGNCRDLVIACLVEVKIGFLKFDFDLAAVILGSEHVVYLLIFNRKTGKSTYVLCLGKDRRHLVCDREGILPVLVAAVFYGQLVIARHSHAGFADVDSVKQELGVVEDECLVFF